jgi:predicted nucleic acid-binding protein
LKLLDTSVAIDHLRGAAPAVALLGRLLDDDDPILASELVRFELLAGVRTHEIDALEEFFSVLRWVPVNATVTRMAGALAREHRRAHSGIGDVDYLIGATALLLDAPLLTTNIRHFPMLKGLLAAY